MAIINVARRVRAAWFDGSNATDVIAIWNEILAYRGNLQTATNGGISSGMLTINVSAGTSYSEVITVPPNTWTTLDNGSVAGVFPDDDFTGRYNTAATSAANIVPALVATDTFKQAVAAAASGMGCMPNITVNGLSNANFDVAIRPMQPGTTFTAVPFLTGSSSLLGNLSITGLSAGGTVQNANKLSTVINGVTWYDRVRVNVANSGALQLAGAALLVHVSP